MQGLPPGWGWLPSVSLPHPFLLYSQSFTPFSVVSRKSGHPCLRWAEGKGDIQELPYSLADTLHHTSCWFPEAWGVHPSPYSFVLLPFPPTPFSVSCFPQPSVPKPFQSFQITIIGEKECAAFSLIFIFKAKGLAMPLLPTSLRTLSSP